jgi:hypothetical protein
MKLSEEQLSDHLNAARDAFFRVAAPPFSKPRFSELLDQASRRRRVQVLAYRSILTFSVLLALAGATVAARNVNLSAMGDSLANALARITGTHVSYSPLRQLTSPYADQSAVDLVHELAGIATVDSAWITNDGQSVVIAAHLNNGLRFFLERSIIGKPNAQPLIVLPDTPGVSIRHISAKTIGKVSVILLEIDTLSKDDRTRILSAIVR